MTAQDVPAILLFEREACAHPSFAWTEENYRSSLASGYWMQVCEDDQGQIIGACVAMTGVDELHLLNIAVARAWHGRGLATHWLGELVHLARARCLSSIWLEVRPSNARARALYAHQGYVEVGLRKNYYPAPEGREDAVVMKREVMA